MNFNWLTQILYIPVKWIYNLNTIEKFTLVLSIIAAIQAWTFMHSERAFVYPTTANFIAGSLIANMPDTRLYIVLKNSGKQTATIEEFNAAITHGLATKPKYANPGTKKQKKFTLPPVPTGVDIEFPLVFESSWADDTTKKVKDGTMKFYIYGKFKYRDSFSLLFPIKESGFCFEYDHLSSNPTKSVFRNCIEPEYTYTK